MEHLEVFHLPPLPPLLSTVYQCDGCLSSWGQYCRLRAVPLRSVTSKFGRTGDSELTERGTGERREEEGLPSLLNQTCSGNSAHQRRQLVKNKLICHLISNNSASICRALNPHGLLSTANVCFSS